MSHFQGANFNKSILLSTLKKRKKKESTHEMGEQNHQLKETRTSKLQRGVSCHSMNEHHQRVFKQHMVEGLEKRKESPKVLVGWNCKQPLTRALCRCPKGKLSSLWTSSQCLREYPGKIRTQKEICTQICSALPVTTAKICKQTVRPHECMKWNSDMSSWNMIQSWHRMK